MVAPGSSNLTGRAVWLCSVILTLSLVGACGDDGGKAEPASTTTGRRGSTTTAPTWNPPTTAEPAEEAAVRAAYEAAELAAQQASSIPDPDHVALLATHTGPMLEQRRKVLLALKAEGRIIRYRPDSQYRNRLESVVVNGDTAVLQVCAVDDGERVVAATGEVVASGVFTGRLRVGMRRVEGVWRLAERTKEEEWQGVAGCAAE